MSAPSRFGKTFLSLPIIKSAQKKGMSVVVIDTERRFPFKTAQSFGIDISKEKLQVLRENSIEEVRTIILKILDGISREDRKNILFIIDSFGVLTSSKSMEDGLVGKDVKDMTLTQKKNELSNIILNTHATFFVLNHCYDNVGGWGDPLAIPGGRRLYFNSSSVILCTSRAKEKDKDKVINGYIITAKAHKGDFCKEDTVLEFKISNTGGLNTFYGLIEDAKESGVISNSKPGWFIRTHIKDDTPVKEENIYNTDFWLPIFKQTNFGDWLNKKYQYSNEFDIVKDADKLNTISNREEMTQPELLVENNDESKSKKSKKQ
jgi:RecA/RadA recombinase